MHLLCHVPSVPHSPQFSKDPGLASAQRILANMRRRRLYRFVDEVLVPHALLLDEERCPKPTPEAIAQFNPDPAIQLRPEHIAVQTMKLGA